MTTALDVAIEISDLFEATGSEGTIVSEIFDTEILPFLKTPLHETDTLGLGDRFGKAIERVRTTLNQQGSDRVRNLMDMMKSALLTYVQRTHDTITGREIFNRALKSGAEIMLTVTAAAILANALAKRHAEQAKTLMKGIAGRLSGAQPIPENSSGAAVSAGAIATATTPLGKKKQALRRRDSIFAENVVQLNRRSERVDNPAIGNPGNDLSNVSTFHNRGQDTATPRDADWSANHQLPPDIKDMTAQFGHLLTKIGAPKDNIVPFSQETEEEPEIDLAAAEAEMAAKAGWRHVDTEKYPSGNIMIFATPSRHGSAHYLYVYPGGEWKYSQTRGGPGSFAGFIDDHTRSRANFESLSWDDLQGKADRVAILSEIANSQQDQLVEAVLVDPITAELVLAVHGSLAEPKKRRYECKPMREMIEIAHRAVQRGLIQVVAE